MIVAMTVIMILLALYLITITFYLVCQIRVPSNPSYKIHDMVKHSYTVDGVGEHTVRPI